MTCPHCGSQQLSSATVCLECGTTLRIIERTPQERGIRIASIVILIGVLAAGIGYFFMTIGRTYHPVIDHQPSVGYGVAPAKERINSTLVTARMEGNDIVIPLEQVSGYRIVRLYDPEGVQTVPVLIYITPRGKVVTAMSISESCRSDDFYLEGEDVHCAHCPSYWNMESMEAYACCQRYYPEPIKSVVEDRMIRIDKHIVQQWRARI